MVLPLTGPLNTMATAPSDSPADFARDFGPIGSEIVPSIPTNTRGFCQDFQVIEVLLDFRRSGFHNFVFRFPLSSSLDKR